jgi:carbonic anhydrase
MFRAKITTEPAGVAVGRDAKTAGKATVTVHRLWDRMPTTVGTEESVRVDIDPSGLVPRNTRW